MDQSIAIFDIEITVLDYESTGSLSGYANEPWQIGMVSLKAGKVDASSLFESLLRVDANRPFNPHAPGRHAAMREAIADAPTQQELWPQMEGRLIDRPLCAHNIATEKKFTRAAAPMHVFGPWLDTLRITRRVWPGLSSYALNDLISTLNLRERVERLCAGRGAHDALYDAVASAMLLEYLLEQSGWEMITLGEIMSL